MSKNYYRKKPLVVRNVVNWRNPSADDVAAGLSEDQEAALRDETGGSAATSLTTAVPGWRPPLLAQHKQNLLLKRTAFGEAVNRALASGMSAFGQDAEERLEAKPASPTAEGGDAQ